jgi:beta-ureidopropionase / N-carbamoyl-L-amino-acid hydrolase
MTPRINRDRLLGRLETFNRIGALPGGGNCRLALSDEDRAGRDLLVQWMRELGLAVTIDAIGNIVGVRAGREDLHDDLAPVMFGSHVDTVGTGGRYDGLRDNCKD